MSEINNNLLGFLKKKTLFSTSPSKAQRRESSKDSKDITRIRQQPRKIINQEGERDKRPSPGRSVNLHNPHFDNEFFDDTKSEKKDYASNLISTRFPVEKTKKINASSSQKVLTNPEISSPIRYLDQPTKVTVTSPNQFRHQEPQNLFEGILNYSSRFQSARSQSAECLQNLTVKVQNQLSSINYRIEMFQSKVTSILNKEFDQLQQKINQIVSTIFKESHKNIQNYIKQQQQKLASDLLSMKQELETHYMKVQTMKEEILKPQWKKVAGQLLSSELEERIEDTIKKSSNIQINHWEFRSIPSTKIEKLETLLRDMVAINR